MGLVSWIKTGEWSQSSPPAIEKRQLASVAYTTDITSAMDSTVETLIGAGDSAIPAVYRSAQFLADSVASLHMQQVDERTRIADAVTPALLRRPDPSETYHASIHKLMASLVWRGNAYLRPTVWDDGQVDSAIVLHPDEVTVTWDSRRIYPEYRWRGRPMRRNVDIVHIPLNQLPGEIVGLSPITAARKLWEGMRAEATFSTQLVADNATPSGLLHSEKPLTRTEADEVRDVWEGSHLNRKRVGVTSGSVKFEPLTINPVDAQFLETRQFSVQETARIFGIPAFFLGVDSGSSMTYSTTESLFRLLVTGTLRPTYLERIEQAFSMLLPMGKLARFNIDELLRADLKARYDAHEIGLRNGFLTPNEIRRGEGLTPLPNGDVPRSPAPAGGLEAQL